MNYTLKSAQLAGLAKGRHRDGFGYFMEQGLGKTLVTLDDFQSKVDNREATRMVVIAPNSFKGGWRTEIQDKGFDYHAHVFNSGADWDNNSFIQTKFNKPAVLIVNYEAIRSKSTQEYIQAFTAGRSVMGTLDESIQIKTHNSEQTKAALALAPYFRYHRILSGKPQTTGPHDLWAQMRFIRQLEGRNYYAFRNAFCKMGGFKMKQVMGAQNEDILAELIGPHTFTASKKDWTDLPPKIYLDREYDPGPIIKKHYKEMYEHFVTFLEDGSYVSVDVAISKFEKLSQILTGYIINENGGVEELVPISKNPRLNTLLNVVEDEVKGKFSVVYRHKYAFDALYHILAKYNPTFIKGQMSPEEVESNKYRFNNDPKCRGILLQADAAKYGHTLLGGPGDDHCSTQLVFENTYNLDTRAQVEDRHHRYGQLGESVNYIDFYGSPLDKEMNGSLRRKENMFQSVFKRIREIPMFNA